MKRKIILSTIFLGTLALTACGIKNPIAKTETPEQVIKDLQVNLVDSIKSTVLSKQNAKGNTSMSLDVSTPVGKGNFNLSMDAKGVGSTGEANIKLNGDFNVMMPQAMSGTLNLDLDMISTLQKIYLNVKDLGIQSTNPQLMMYNQVVGMIKGKWIYIENNSFSQNITKVVKDISFKDELGKYSLLKVNKKLGDYKYQVSLDKQNIAQVIYDINKKLDSNFSGNVDGIKNQLGSGDINAVLEVESNKKYFTLSGDLILENQIKVPLVIQFTEKKFVVKVSDKFILDLNRNGDEFDGYASFKDSQENSFKITISGMINNKSLKLKLGFDENGVKVDFIANGTYEDLDKIEVTVPKDAISIQDLQKGFGQ